MYLKSAERTLRQQHAYREGGCYPWCYPCVGSAHTTISAFRGSSSAHSFISSSVMRPRTSGAPKFQALRTASAQILQSRKNCLSLEKRFSDVPLSGNPPKMQEVELTDTALVVLIGEEDGPCETDYDLRATWASAPQHGRSMHLVVELTRSLSTALSDAARIPARRTAVQPTARAAAEMPGFSF